ncbi:ER lumen protein-retaining receptor [Nasonia vitripennis]|uniref:ER lumen protein-retaining receptor n=1 Tax=Nasonia vitripennis TaxID=7425 RepID=A0A7M7G501_NASVI|nr:ER lumen protein-retaining receptor [Nasonia vitripennis]
MDTVYNVANYLHMLTVLSLLLKIWCTQNCSGISAKSQFLLVLVYTTRYLDLYTTFISKYNTVMKVLYLVIGYCTLLSMYAFFRKTYERKYDSFRIELLLIPCMVIAILINYNLTAIEVLWTFSIHLEAVAMVPQFVFVSKARRIHKHVLYYVLSLATYKCLYIIHWVYRYYQEAHYDKFSVAGGIIQFVLYVDFLVRIVPHLPPVDEEDKQQQVATVGADFARLEGQLPQKSGYLNENMSTVVLDPAFLKSKDNDKVNLLKAEEASSGN